MKYLAHVSRLSALALLGLLAATRSAAQPLDPTPEKAAQPREIVFIDASVPGREVLLAGLKAGVEADVLASDRDGFEQIAQALASRRQLEAIHIVSHASPGNVHLGNGVLNDDTLAAHLGQLRTIGQALIPGGEVLLYGCRLGAETEGRSFLDHFSHAVGAPVRASSKLTGSYALGGTWTLDAGLGRDRALAFNEMALAHYGYLLTTPSSQTFQSFSALSPAAEPSPVTFGSFTFTGFVGGSPIGNGEDILDNDDGDFGIIGGTTDFLPSDTGFVFNDNDEILGAADYRIAAGTGNNFALTSIQADLGVPGFGSITTITVTGYLAGVAVSGATATLDLSQATASNNSVTYTQLTGAAASNGGTITFSGNANFKNIDEFRFTGGSSGQYVALAVDDITVGGPIPSVTSATTASGTYGSAFSYSITASNGPLTSYGETGTLPTGVTLNTGTGLISGTPTTNGSFPVTITATNGNGTSIAKNLTITIAKAVLTVTGITANNKPYDRTTAATLNTGSAVFSGVVNSDILTVGGSATGTFAAASVGTGITVTISGVTAVGANSANYTVTQPTTTANITAVTLTVTGITANNKPYDRTTAATLNTGSAVLVGVLAGDTATVTLNAGSAVGTFASSSVGTGITVNVSGLTLNGGATALNYTLTQPSTTANITAVTLTVTGITANNKPYDRTTAATLSTGSAVLVGVLAGDTATVTLNAGSAVGTFASSSVGTGITVNVSGLTLNGGATALNYTLTQPSTTANITAVTLTVTGITANNKPYDRTTAATLSTGSAVLVGVLAGDTATVTLNAGSAVGTFASSSVGTGITVNVSGLTLNGGATALNYSLTQPSTTANITAVTLTVTGITANNKPYDRTTAATLSTGSAVLVGVLAGDTATVTLNAGSAVGTFASSSVGTGITVNVSGLTLNGGATALNYTLTQPSTTANITAVTLTVTGITANNKPYDRTTAATLSTGSAVLVGVLAGDTATVTLNAGSAVGTFASSSVGTGITVNVSGLTLNGGATALNYTLTQPSTTANITAVTLTVTGITANNKPYDRTTAATLSTGSAVLVGVLAGDTATVTLNTGSAVGTFASSSVGTGITVNVSGLTLNGGATALNYSLTQPSTTANITVVTLTVTGITANNKPYDRTTAATLNTGSAALVGVLAGDTATVTLNTGSAVGTFASSSVGTGITVNVSGLTLNGGATALNYTLTQPTTTANITAVTLTVTGITASSRPYNRTTAATLNTGSAALVGVLAGDTATVTLNTGSAVGTFASSSVGTGITVNVSGLTLNGGATALNYTLTQPSTTANITAVTLTVTGITASNKPYDKTTAAGLNTGSAALVGVIAGDTATVTLNTGSAVGTFASSSVGTGITVTVSGLTLNGGATALNYTLTQPTTTANITTVTLTVTGITANNKPYDRTTAATLNTGGAALVGVLAGDTATVTLNTGSAVGTFASSNVGTGVTVNVSGLTLNGGATALNYTLTQPTTTANITAVALTVSGVTANSRAYTATTAATLNVGSAALVGVIAPDVVTINTTSASGTFATKIVGTTKTVTISGITIGGANAGNYTLTQPTATANITAAGLTVTGITANNKAYDRTTSATINTGSAALSGVLLSDIVTLNVASATGVFATNTVANGKTVTVSGITIGGADATNYALTQPAPTANITALALTVSGVTASNKPYDQTTAATIDVTSAALVGIIAPDVVTLDTTSAAGAFADKTVGVAKTVTVSGMTIGGADAANYTLTKPTPTANITAIGLTVTGITAANKGYDATTSATLNTVGAALSGVITGDVVTLNVTSASGAFVSKVVGSGNGVNVSGLTIGGADAGNYTLSQPITTANISSAGLTVSGITAANKAYDATTTAVLNTAGAVLGGVFGGDSVTLNTAGATGNFANKAMGAGKTVTITGLTIGGTDAGNYVLATPVTTATITASGLTVTGITAANKPYDGTTTATLTTSGAALVGVIPGDTVTLNSTLAVGTFAAKTVGTGKTVTVSGLALGGADAGNYTLTQPTTTANITSTALTLSGVTASNKMYDTTTAAMLNSSSATLVGVATGDTVTFTAGTGAFASKTVGVAKPVTTTGFSLGGADAADYTLTQPTPTASITAAGLTVTGITTSNKVYDATTAAAIDTSAAALSGVLAGDAVSLSTATAAGIFSSKDVGTGKTVTVSGLTTSGGDAGNYVLAAPTTTANITAAGLTVTGITASDKVFDGTAAATLDTTGAALVGVLTGDTVNLDTTAATGAFPSAAIGSGLTVTISGLTINGTDSGDYALTQPTTTASINPVPSLGGGGGGGTGGGTGGGGSTLTAQQITFTPIPGHLPTDAPFTLSAISSSGLPVTFAVTSGPATVSGSTVTLSGTPGTVTIVATQAGNGTFAAASASQTFNVGTNLGRLVNLSARAYVGTGDNVLIAGFVFGGSTPKQFLVRAVGPTLATFGVPSPLANPTLQIFDGGTQISGVTGWSSSLNASAIAAAATALGAFPLPVGSADAAILAPFNPGAYTAIVSGTGATSGNALLELYDAAGGSGGQNLMNLSARGFVGQGSQVLIAGLVINGNSTAKILIRAVGPGLVPFGVHAVLTDPQVQVFQGSTLVAQNAGWNNDATVTAANQLVGAFPLAAGSKDSALVVTLPSGNYTAVVSGASGDTGIALVEVYLLPN